jgi:hypothetical protein
MTTPSDPEPVHCTGCAKPDGFNGETHQHGTIEHPDAPPRQSAAERDRDAAIAMLRRLYEDGDKRGVWDFLAAQKVKV